MLLTTAIDAGTDGVALPADEEIEKTSDQECFKLLIQKVVGENYSLQKIVTKIITNMISVHICHPLMNIINEYIKHESDTLELELIAKLKGEIAKYISSADQNDLEEFITGLRNLTKNKMDLIIDNFVKNNIHKLENESIEVATARLSGSILNITNELDNFGIKR